MTAKELLAKKMAEKEGVTIEEIYENMNNLEGYEYAKFFIEAMEEYAALKVESFKSKADQWDALYSRIEKYYFDENGNPLPEDEGDGLISIGEAAASAFGFF